MIIHSHTKLKVGDYGSGNITAYDGKVHFNVPLQILQESNFEEFMECLTEHGGHLRADVHYDIKSCFFYRISVD